jgi:glycosyltransferase involved in cell wall biosynthesis
MTHHIGFLMDQIAGHVTAYRNLRPIAEADPELAPTWHEIHYRRPGGMIESVRDRLLPFVPTYATGIMRGAFELHRALRGQRYDALMTNASVGVFFSHVFRQTPTLLDIDSTPRQIDRMPAYGSSDDPASVADLKFRLFRTMLRAVALVQARSNWARDSVIAEYGLAPEKVVVNPHGVDIDYWRPGPAEMAAPGAPRRVLFVGGDFRRKGGPLLLEWHRRQEPSRYELHIVTREPVEAGSGVFVYHDLAPNSSQLLSLYQRSHLFVLPSLGECFGIATVEAMATGLPVIQTDIGGAADIIQPGRNGLIIPSDDPRALTEAIAAILSDDARRDRMGQQSRLIAEQRFDLQQTARRTLAYVKQLAADRQAAMRVPA